MGGRPHRVADQRLRAGRDGRRRLIATFRAPKQPGRYALVWDVRQGDGPWQSTQPVSVGNDLLQVFVTVGGKGQSFP